MKKLALVFSLMVVSLPLIAEELVKAGEEEEAIILAEPVAKNTRVAALGSSNTAETAPGQIEAPAPKPSEAKIFGLLDLRPSYDRGTGALRSENTIEGGYQFNKNHRLTYTQWWNTTKDLYQGVYAHDGFFRFRANNLWSSGPLSLNYQGRLFLPTFATRREAGFVGSLFNQMQLALTLSPAWSVSLSTAPTLPYYSRASHNGKANLAFENMAVASVDWTPFTPFTLSLPFYLISRKTRAAAVPGSTDWSHLLVFWPEATYTIDANHAVGLSFYTDNLVTPTMDQFTIDKGIANGVIQAFWTVRI